jgi:hypothetical protein
MHQRERNNPPAKKRTSSTSPHRAATGPLPILNFPCSLAPHLPPSPPQAAFRGVAEKKKLLYLPSRSARPAFALRPAVFHFIHLGKGLLHLCVYFSLFDNLDRRIPAQSIRKGKYKQSQKHESALFPTNRQKAHSLPLLLTPSSHSLPPRSDGTHRHAHRESPIRASFAFFFLLLLLLLRK